MFHFIVHGIFFLILSKMEQDLTFMMCKRIFYLYFHNFQCKGFLQGAVVGLIELESGALWSREVLYIHSIAWMVLGALQKQNVRMLFGSTDPR